MPTFIDESGDTGQVLEGGKPYFRLAAVWIPSHLDAEALRAKIKQVRRDLGLRVDYEFKFSKTHSTPGRRAAFLAAALTQEFRFAFCSINKLDDEWTSSDRQALYRACATDLAVSLKPLYHQAEAESTTSLREPIIVDDNEDREFLAVIKEQFRGLKSKQRPGSSLIGRVAFRDSAPDEMLQLVDMVCGAAGALIDGGDATWYGMIADRHMP